MEAFVIQLLNGVTYGMLLFLLAAGLTQMYGLMGIVNLAHGSYFTLGAYIGYSVMKATGNFLLAVAAGAFSVAVFSLFMERFFLRRLHGNILGQVLLTFGFVYIIADLSLWVWGGVPFTIAKPGFLTGSITIMGSLFPVYRLSLLFIGLVMVVVLWLFQERTRLGAIIRAGVDDKQMVSGLGINIAVIFTMVFAIGAFLAGFAGVVGGPLLGIYPGQDNEVLTLALVVIVVGGLGNMFGALAGSLLIGVIDVFAKAVIPGAAMSAMFLTMFIILAVKPSGLLPR